MSNNEPKLVEMTTDRGVVLAAEARKSSLRAMTQERVHHFTHLKREEIRKNFFLEHGYEIDESELDRLQPLIEEYDPVVELSLIASDYALEPSIRRQANSDAAQYLRPKLSAVKIMDDPEAVEVENQKMRLANRLVEVMETMAAAKKLSSLTPSPSSENRDD